MRYKFKYKRYFWWNTKEVIGHSLERDYDGKYNTNRMVLYFEGGGIEVISDWNKYCLKLGNDWVLAQKNAMEKEIGQELKLNVKV
jgi:hypothetical protein